MLNMGCLVSPYWSKFTRSNLQASTRTTKRSCFGDFSTMKHHETNQNETFWCCWTSQYQKSLTSTLREQNEQTATGSLNMVMSGSGKTMKSKRSWKVEGLPKDLNTFGIRAILCYFFGCQLLLVFLFEFSLEVLNWFWNGLVLFCFRMVVWDSFGCWSYLALFVISLVVPKCKACFFWRGCQAQPIKNVQQDLLNRSELTKTTKPYTTH